MEIEKLRYFATLIVDCYVHDGWTDEDDRFHHESRDSIDRRVDAVLAYFDCPVEWRPIICCLAQAADYYGYERDVFTDL